MSKTCSVKLNYFHKTKDAPNIISLLTQFTVTSTLVLDDQSSTHIQASGTSLRGSVGSNKSCGSNNQAGSRHEKLKVVHSDSICYARAKRQVYCKVWWRWCFGCCRSLSADFTTVRNWWLDSTLGTAWNLKISIRRKCVFEFRWSLTAQWNSS